ncbi:MAG: helix-hairpin-helix domain-containing protein, partial [Micromonosporaceae bacterium]
MAPANREIAAALVEYAELLTITGGDAFKARSYEKAARSIAGHHEDLAGLELAGLRAIPNVGKSIADKALEVVR